MDQREYDLRVRELRTSRWSAVATAAIAILSFALSAVAVTISVNQSASDAKSSQEQYNTTARATLYNDIVTSLGSPSAGVQQNAMRQLVAYVKNEDNFGGPGALLHKGGSPQAQQDAARDAVQILTAFIEDKSTVQGQTGLSEYERPEPIILPRAMFQLEILADDSGLGPHTVDVSRANFHGIPLSNFAPQGGLLAVAADFRAADLVKLDLHREPADLRYAFFTCAHLNSAKFGRANMDAADLTGANLRGADLSHVRNLTSAQLRGATVGPRTQLPPNVHVDASQAWGTDSSRCNNLIAEMTGMHGGQGYLDSDPCPTTAGEAKHATFRPKFDGSLSDLVNACTERTR
jgi:Pentapeptide repeats (8 copies)